MPCASSLMPWSSSPTETSAWPAHGPWAAVPASAAAASAAAAAGGAGGGGVRTAIPVLRVLGVGEAAAVPQAVPGVVELGDGAEEVVLGDAGVGTMGAVSARMSFTSRNLVVGEVGRVVWRLRRRLGALPHHALLCNRAAIRWSAAAQPSPARVLAASSRLAASRRSGFEVGAVGLHALQLVRQLACVCGGVDDACVSCG